jgi:hypothetical protein
VIGVFEREAWEAEKKRRGVFGGEKFDREGLGRDGADPGEYKEK